jgi:uncharacterized protein YgbK (DUF1537 family)
VDGTVGAPALLTVLGLSDDLTGAVALGAELAGAGLASVIVPGTALDVAIDSSALVVDTGTRRLDQAAAVAATAAVIDALRPRIGPATLVIKRIDSGLRGPWSAELAELSRLLDRHLIAATGAPALGVTVEGGVQYVVGTSASVSHYALDGEASGSAGLIASMPAPAVSVSVDELVSPTFPDTAGALLRQYRALVCDGATSDHLVAAARAIVRAPPIIAVSTYGLGRALARAVAEGPAQTLTEQPASHPPVLALVGSDKPMTASQVDHARTSGWAVVAASEAGAEPEVADRLLRGERVVLEVGLGQTTARRDARHAILVAEIGARVIAAVSTARVIIIGGETASAFAAAAGIASIEPIAEPWPTIAVLRLRSRLGASLLAIVKSGAQGERWWLVHAADVLAVWGMPESR